MYSGRASPRSAYSPRGVKKPWMCKHVAMCTGVICLVVRCLCFCCGRQEKLPKTYPRPVISSGNCLQKSSGFVEMCTFAWRPLLRSRLSDNAVSGLSDNDEREVLSVLPTKGIEPNCARANVGNRESMSLLYNPVLIVTCVPQLHLWEVS
jgi:hypothetical protein